ncbi:MAG: hypothetical protein Q9196_003006 [Gyalolechia fulgens]
MDNTYPGTQLRFPCYLLHDVPRDTDFVGREHALNAVGEVLLPPRGASMCSGVEGPKVFALCGMGGIGKTEIAIEFAHRHQSRFDAVLWARACSPDTLAKSFWEIVVRLGLEEPCNKGDPEANKQTLRSWLSNPWKPVAVSDADPECSPFQRCRATWLLVLDGADDPLILQDFWPLRSGSILITSRDPSAKVIFSAAPAGLDLQPLQTDVGALLLKFLTNRVEDGYAAAEDLTKLLGGLPLAVSQIAKISVSRKLSLVEMYRLYNEPSEHANLHDASDELDLSVYPYTLATVWKMETLSPEAKTLLDVLGFLYPGQVREALFTDMYHDHGVLDFPSDPASFPKARNELMRLSLVKWNQEGIDLTIHRVVQDVVIAKLEAGRFNALFSFTVFLVWFNWPSALPGASRRKTGLQPKRCHKRDIISRWPWCASLYPHVVRLKDMWQLTNNISVPTKMRFAALLLDAAWYQHEKGYMQDFDELRKTSIDICAKIESPDKGTLLIDTHFVLGAIAADTNRHEDSQWLKEVGCTIQFVVSKDIGRPYERLFFALVEVSVSRIQTGRYQDAITMLLAARDGRRKVFTSCALAGQIIDDV